MEVLSVTAFIKYGTPAVLLFLIILQVWQTVTFKGMVCSLQDLRAELKDLKKNIIFEDTHTEIEKLHERDHNEFNRRITSVESWKDRHLVAPQLK